MAHFAKINSDLEVENVVVISNDDIIDADGVEQESMGIAICEATAGPGRWIQTSYNHSFRGIFASVGFKYSEQLEIFYDPVKPYPSWTLGIDGRWHPPAEEPADGDFYWDEDSLSWEPMNA